MNRRVAVVCGGSGAESEVSRASGAEVSRALRALGHDTTLVEVDGRLWSRLRDGRFDVAFLALHGRFGEDGTVQGVCELLGLPYTGSGVLASALSFHKAAAKGALRAAGLSTPDWVVVPGGASQEAAAGPLAEAAASLGLPMVVKPVEGGSTIGLTIVRETASLGAAHAAAGDGGDVICERFVTGCEITVGILGHNPPRALPTLEIVSHRPLYDYAAKYTPGQSEHVIPARLPEGHRRAAQEAALAAHRALGCRDISRTDVIVDGSGTPWVLEVNSIPGLTALSLLPDAARAAGMELEAVCHELVEAAIARR